MLRTQQDRGAGPALAGPLPPSRAADIQAIFEQARQRRKRRRLLGAAVASVLAGAVAAVGLTAGGGSHGPAARGGAAGPRAVTAKSGTDRTAAWPAVRMAWVDSAGDLQIGDLATGAQRAGPAIDASQSAALVPAGGQLYWADSNRNVAPIRDYDLATGKIRYLATGEAVFAAGDGRHLYIVRDSRTLLELHPDGSGSPAVLRVPVGWFVAAHAYQWFPWEGTVAGGVIVYSSGNPNDVPATATTGIWNPATGRVRILGRGVQIASAYTSPGARYSMLVWVAPGSGPGQDYSLRITNTATMTTVTARSPLHHGFAWSGAPAFSPDGTRMAVFVRTAVLGSSTGMSRLAIIDTSTGAVRVAPGTALDTTEDAFWAVWLPGSQQVLAGAMASGYAVDAQTLRTRPFSYFPSVYGFSAVVIPAPQSRH